MLARPAASVHSPQEPGKRLGHALFGQVRVTQQPYGIAIEAWTETIVNLSQGLTLQRSSSLQEIAVGIQSRP